MPRANIYIRKENWDLWEALPDKSKFVNEHLDRAYQNKPASAEPIIGMTPTPIRGMKMDGAQVVPMMPRPVVAPKGIDMDKLRGAQAGRSLDFCRHDQVKGFCKKGCK